MRIVFFGSSDFAIPSLKALKAGGCAPELVVTKPDAPRGRGRKIYDSEVKLAAEEIGLPCEQPVDLHAPEFVQRLRDLKPDLGVVVSYGVILKAELLALPKHGLINAHASLLPLYRGAAPIQRALRDGHAETGVTIMFVTHNVREAARLGDRILVLASRPGRVIADYAVDLPRPRRIESPEVSALAAEVTDCLRTEVRRHADD